MEKIFEVVLKDDEVLGVYWGVDLLGVIIRPTLEKVIKLTSSSLQNRCTEIDGKRLMNERIYQYSHLELGIENNGFRNLEGEIKLEYSYDVEDYPRGLGTTLWEKYNLKIVKILI